MIRLKFYLPIRSTKKVDSDFADPIMLTQTMQANDSATHHRLQQHGWTTKGLADYIIEQKRGEIYVYQKSWHKIVSFRKNACKN